MPEIILQNQISQATITANPAFEANLPVSNIALPGKVACSTGAANQTITINLPQSRYVANEGIVLSGRFSPYATLRATLHGALNATGAVQADSGTVQLLRGDTLSPTGALRVLPPLYFYQRFVAAQVGDMYWSMKLLLSDPSPPSGRHQLYRAILGSVFIPRVSTTYEKSWSITLQDTTAIERSDSSDARAAKGFQRRIMEIPLDVTDAERLEITRSFRAVGKTSDVFAHVAPASTGLAFLEHGMIGFFAESPQFSPVEYDRNAVSLRVQESALGFCQVAVVV